MQTADTFREYHKQLLDALADAFQRKALDRFAVAYREGREQFFAGIDRPGLVRGIAAARDAATSRIDTLYRQFREKAEAAGAHVHLARSGSDANALIERIAAENGCRRIVKSKSMTAEEIHLNPFLESRGYRVAETDLGEWIVQLRRESPSHMVLPAIHLSRTDVGRLFTQVTGQPQEPEIDRLVKVARRELRQRFAEADMGITGANFAVAGTGTLGLVTNEGNARLVTTIPRVHVVLAGLDKLVPTLHDALRQLSGLTRNATGQPITSYVTWITGANACKGSPGGRKIVHVVFLDNGRSALAEDPVFSEVLRCVRCGACANVCPIYRLVGGHRYGHVYIGAIGLVLTYFYHGRNRDKYLVRNCLNCQACKDICVAGIDLPRLIKEVEHLVEAGEGPSVTHLTNRMAAGVVRRRPLFHSVLRAGRYGQLPVTLGSDRIRYIPPFLRMHDFKTLPALARKPFRDRWHPGRSAPRKPFMKVAMFAGCLQDFIYPEQLEAVLDLLAGSGVKVDFPVEQGCCGLPLYMLGERESAAALARYTVDRIDPAEYDFIMTCCPSCGSHMKHNFPFLLQAYGRRVKVGQFSEKVIDYSSFIARALDVATPEWDGAGVRIAYHAPCHMCRGLYVTGPPRRLLGRAGYTYVPHDEEETCCGLGGTYSFKFPEISAAILDIKLDALEKTGAGIVATDCPGCVMQLRGGAMRQKRPIRVVHLSEAMAMALKR